MSSNPPTDHFRAKPPAAIARGLVDPALTPAGSAIIEELAHLSTDAGRAKLAIRLASEIRALPAELESCCSLGTSASKRRIEETWARTRWPLLMRTPTPSKALLVTGCTRTLPVWCATRSARPLTTVHCIPPLHDWNSESAFMRKRLFPHCPRRQRFLPVPSAR